MRYSNSPLFSDIGGFALLVILLVAWSVVWKALALWRSARLGSKGWFIVFLFLNTAGILEIIYLYALSKPESSEIKKA